MGGEGEAVDPLRRLHLRPLARTSLVGVNVGDPVSPAPILVSVPHACSGRALVVMPAIFVFAFATHPGLGSIQLLEPADLILRARGNPVLQFAHALVTLDTALLVVVALHLQARMVLLPLGVGVQAIGLMRSGAWSKWQGAALLAGSLLIATPHGLEIVNLTAALALLVALAPQAVRLAATATR